MDPGGRTADVTYTITYNAAIFAGSAELTNIVLGRVGLETAKLGVAQNESTSFQKFDDGWRVR